MNIQGNTTTTVYEPTPAEKKLLEVWSDPMNRHASVTERCRIAGIHRDTYYEATRKQGFINLIQDTALRVLNTKMLDVIHATYEAAIRGSFQDRKLIFEMVGITRNKPQEHSLPNSSNTFFVLRGEDPIESLNEISIDHPKQLGSANE